MDDPVVRAAGLESVEAWNRRCLTMEWDDDSAAPPVGPRSRMTSQLCKELSMVLINRVTNEIINGRINATYDRIPTNFQRTIRLSRL